MKCIKISNNKRKLKKGNKEEEIENKELLEVIQS